MTPTQSDTTLAFTQQLWDAKTHQQLHWMGTKIFKCPSDLLIYQEILHGLKPDLIIECGTCHGGSALYLAHILDLCGLPKSQVVTIDSQRRRRPKHPRIEYLQGFSTSEDIKASVNSYVSKVRKRVQSPTIMVILDSDHSKANVLAEMKFYGRLVTFGSYMIVEDTVVNGHPVRADYGPGPREAVEMYLPKHPEFEVDETKHKFFVTFNYRGYLKRV